MGLDAVELVMEVEEHFGVTIHDEDAGDIRTVGDLLDLIAARIKRRDEAGCLSLPWFLKLRRLTREAAQKPELRIRPASRVAIILPASERKIVWQGLEELAKLPPRYDLQRPSVIDMVIALLAIASPVVFLTSLALLQSSLLVVSVALAFGAWVLTVATRPFKTIPPIGCETFGEITQRLVGLEAAANGYPIEARELIFADLAIIIAEQLGVDRKKVTPEARFVEDLGMM